MKSKKATKLVKILGREVREDTKKHALLLEQLRQFNDLRQAEVGNGR